MNRQEAKACILQMSQLWTNYKAPQDNEEMILAVGTWLQFFGNAAYAEVSRTISEIAAEGGEFAPQIGQIYARFKAKRVERLQAASEIEIAYRNNARVLAKMLGVEPPSGDIKLWLEGIRNEQPG